jgi:hypothetical protein
MNNKATEIHSTTQKFLDIYDVVNDLVILKDGATSLIISIDAMNFGLLAEEEQDAIIYSYAGLLNSLNYPIQIVIKSQTKDVTKYLHILDEELTKTTSEIKREWIKKYRSFVGNLIKERNVLDKKFYIVIPASSLEMGLLAPSTVIPGVKQTDLSTIERSVILDKAREVLEPKRDHIVGQFGRIGLIAKQLTTQEIIQLFYLSYNPEAAEGQQITNTSSYTTPLVNASVVKRGGIMNDTPVMPGAATPAPTDTNAAPMAPVAPIDPVAPVAPVDPVAPIVPPVEPTPVSPEVDSAQGDINSVVGEVPAAAPTPMTPPAAAPTEEITPPAAA